MLFALRLRQAVWRQNGVAKPSWKLLMLRVIRPLKAALRMRLWRRLKKSSQISVVESVTISSKRHRIPPGTIWPNQNGWFALVVFAFLVIEATFLLISKDGIADRNFFITNNNAIDMHVGKRVRLRRTLLDMSQEQLGAELNVTFQQMQ